MDLEQLREIAKKYLEGAASEEEEAKLHEHYNKVNREETETVITLTPVTAEGLKWEILASLRTKMQPANEDKDISTPRRQVISGYWKAAAAILIISVAGLLYFVLTTPKHTISYTSVTSDINPPATNQATIILADGSKVYLDSLTSGSFARQGAVNLVKLEDGALAYRGVRDGSEKLLYNTLFNPLGSRVATITLSDGTKVWLNAGSWLTYPVSFGGNDRTVSINGEGYFEVAHNAAKPFKVRKEQLEVLVLGTHFNVQAYGDEPDVRVTLAEGKVMVKHKGATQALSPKQQAVIDGQGGITLRTSTDLEAVMAWKNGLFSFKGADIERIMREIARWYNVQVEYKGTVKEKFHVEMGRNTNASNVFKILEATGGVHFIINENKITVMP
jgi:transmembrane sensor